MHRTLIAIMIAAAGSGCLLAPPLRAEEAVARIRAALDDERFETLERLPVLPVVLIHDETKLSFNNNGGVRSGEPGMRDEASFGSCIVVAPDTLLLSAHQVEGLPAVRRVAVAGLVRDVRACIRGRGPGHDDDWAVVRFDPPLESVTPATLDPARPAPGDEVVLVGYWLGQPPRRPPPGVRYPLRTYLRANIVPTPRDEPPGLIHGVLADYDFLVKAHGMSGGAAAVWDDARKDWAVVGVHVAYRFRYGSFWIVIQPLPDVVAHEEPPAAGPGAR